MGFAVRELAIAALACSSLYARIAAAAPTTVTLSPVADTTIFADNDQAASGADDNFFVGDNGSTGGFAERRALLRFDITGIPSNAVVQNVSLTLNMTRTNAGSINDSLYRVLHSWGEGTSSAAQGGGMGGPPTPNSATWAYCFYPTSVWDLPGGDFTGTASATTSVGAVGAYTWSASAMVADVQSWVQDPASNQGWVIIAEARPGGVVTAKRFASREFATTAQRPRLSITYDVTIANDGDAPLPPWSTAALGIALLLLLRRQRSRPSFL